MDYLIPSTDEFIDIIAKAIAKERMKSEANEIMSNLTGVKFELPESFTDTLDLLSEQMWAGKKPNDLYEKELFRKDALAVIQALNLKFMTMT